MADGEQRAGRGFVLMGASKLYFIVTSYGIHFALPRIFTTTDAFGLYATVMAAASVLNNVMIVATVQTVSRFVSQGQGAPRARLAQGLVIQGVLATAVAGAVVILAGWLSDSLLKDARLQSLLWILAVVVFCYGLYAAVVGYFNGLRAFSKQSSLDLVFSTLRLTGVVAGAWWATGFFADGLGQARGAVWGFAGAAMSILVIGVVLMLSDGRRWDRVAPGVPLGQWLGFLGPLWLFHGALNGMLQLDVLALKGSLVYALTGAGMPAAQAAVESSEWVGRYSAAQKFAFVPYQLILSLTFVVFPLVSKATWAGDERSARRVVTSALRFSMLAAFSVAAPIAGAAKGIVGLAYPEAFSSASAALEVLALGVAAFSLFVVSAAILNGAGSPVRSALLALAGCGLVAVFVPAAVRFEGAGSATLLSRVAMVTSFGMFVVSGAALWLVRVRFGGAVTWLTAMRTAVASAVAFLAARLVPNGDAWWGLLSLALGFVSYLFTLFVLRETSKAEIRTALHSLKHRGQ